MWACGVEKNTFQHVCRRSHSVVAQIGNTAYKFSFWKERTAPWLRLVPCGRVQRDNRAAVVVATQCTRETKASKSKIVALFLQESFQPYLRYLQFCTLKSFTKFTWLSSHIQNGWREVFSKTCTWVRVCLYVRNSSLHAYCVWIMGLRLFEFRNGPRNLGMLLLVV